MEAVGFIGGAITLAGLAATLAQWRRNRTIVRWAGALAIVGLAMVATAVVVTARAKAVAPAPARPAATPTASASAPAIATSVAAFAALPADQKKVQMQQAIDRYNAVIDQAYRTLDLTLLPEVTTGPELQVQQQQLGTLKAEGKPTGGDDIYAITGIGVAPALGSVSVRTQGTERNWYLDPKTLQRVGQPNVNNAPATYTFVPEDGVWKVKVVVLG
jgi:hypothetical protein